MAGVVHVADQAAFAAGEGDIRAAGEVDTEAAAQATGDTTAGAVEGSRALKRRGRTQLRSLAGYVEVEGSRPRNGADGAGDHQTVVLFFNRCGESGRSGRRIRLRLKFQATSGPLPPQRKKRPRGVTAEAFIDAPGADQTRRETNFPRCASHQPS